MDIFFAAAACKTGDKSALISGGSLPQTCANATTVTTIFNIAFIVIGALAFLFVVIGGTRYALSKGEPENIQKAKNEIKYSVIGLIIVALAAAIVNFVLDKLK
ncbi:MAG: pilin [Patescibacteria group bacterium]